MRRPTIAILCALAFVACDDKAKPDTNETPASESPKVDDASKKADAKKDDAAKKDEGAAKKGDEAKKKTSPMKKKGDFDKAKASKASAAFRKLLGTGRAKSKAKKWAEAIADFDQALAIDPNHARLLSELGWAHFNAGTLEKAEKFTRSSIDNSRDDRVRGASLYNLGRIHEAREEFDRAATAYTTSLEVRPGNKTVTKRLSMLQAKGAKAEDRNRYCGFRKMKVDKPEPNANDACVQYLSEDAQAMAASAGGTDSECSDYMVDRSIEIEGAHVVTFTYEQTDVDTIVDVIAVIRDDGWWAHEFNHYDRLGNSYNGQTGVFEKLEAKQFLKDSLPGVLMTYGFDFYDGDYGENTVETFQSSVVSLVDPHASTPVFLGSFVTKRFNSFGPWLEEDDLPQIAEEVKRDEASSLTLEWDAVVIADVAGKKPATKAERFMISEIPNKCYSSIDASY